LDSPTRYPLLLTHVALRTMPGTKCLIEGAPTCCIIA
jgi:hypothetical protein